MDDPLIPETLSDNKRNVITGAVVLTLLFFVISIILVFVAGLSDIDFLFSALGVTMLVGTTIILTRWLRKGEMIEAGDQLQYLTFVQVFALILLCSAFLAIVYAPPDYSVCPTCPTCTGCTFYSKSLPTPAGPGTVTTDVPRNAQDKITKPDTCFKCPTCMGPGDSNATVCVWAFAAAPSSTSPLLASIRQEIWEWEHRGDSEE